jgi:hypothetical protein
MNRSYQMPENTEIHEALLFECLKFFNDRILIEDNMNLIDMARLIFDTNKLYYKMNGQDDNHLRPVKFLIFKKINLNFISLVFQSVILRRI